MIRTELLTSCPFCTGPQGDIFFHSYRAKLCQNSEKLKDLEAVHQKYLEKQEVIFSSVFYPSILLTFDLSLHTAGDVSPKTILCICIM